MKLIAMAIAGVFCMLLAACSSFQSEHVVIDEYGVTKGEKFEGIPISVTAAKKLAFLETISTYQRYETSFDADGTASATAAVGKPYQKRTIDPTPIPLGRSEIFTIDPKRPASGTSRSSITLDKDKQYPTLITNDVTDTTLQVAIDGAAKLADKFKPQAATIDNPFNEVLIAQEQHFLVYDPETGVLQRID